MRTCLVCLLWLSCSRKEKEAGITTSSLPGTTLDFIKLDVGKGVALVDTPGLILSHQLTSSLLSDELKAVFPERSIEEVTLPREDGVCRRPSFLLHILCGECCTQRIPRAPPCRITLVLLHVRFSVGTRCGGACFEHNRSRRGRVRSETYGRYPQATFPSRASRRVSIRARVA